MSEAATTTMERFQDHVDLLAGFPFRSASYTTHPAAVRLVRGDNVIQGRLRWDSAMRWPMDQVDGIERYRLELGDVVVAMDRPWIEAGLKYARIGKGDLPALLVQRVSRLRGKGGLDQNFLYSLIGSREFTDHVLAVQTGTAVPHISSGQILDFRFRLPLLGEQRAIAGVLRALDEKIEQNRQTAQALERLAQSIFRAWFVDFEPVKAKAAGATGFPSMPQSVFDALPKHLVESDLGPVPVGWEAKALTSICTLVSGGTPKRSKATYWDGDVSWYSVKDAPDHGELWVIKTSERISADGLMDSAARVVPKGSTIISARGTVGKLAMAAVPMAFNQSCYGLLPGDGKSFGYLHLLMQSVVAELKQRTHGSVFDTITRATFDGLLVTSPPAEIMSTFESVVEPLLALLLTLVDESSKLAAMREYLLPKLLSGDVHVEATYG